MQPDINSSLPFYHIVDDQPGFIVVHKYPGVAVQGASDGLSLVSIVKKDHYLESLFPVHRLDVATSGLVVMAKTKEVNQALSLAFQRKEVNKIYLAVTSKKTSKKQGLVLGDMERARGGSFKLTRSKENPSKTAFFSYGLGGGLRLIVLKPYTGKTHQLRVALKSLSAPILGDERYGGESSDRMYLHAFELRFTLLGKTYSYSQLPVSGEVYSSAAFSELMGRIGPSVDLRWPV